MTYTYASNGNITQKTDVGDLTYGTTKLNAVSSIDGPEWLNNTANFGSGANFYQTYILTIPKQ